MERLKIIISKRQKFENLKVQEQVNLAKEGIYLKGKKTLTPIKSKEADVASLEKQFGVCTQSI